MRSQRMLLSLAAAVVGMIAPSASKRRASIPGAHYHPAADRPGGWLG